MLYVSQKTIGVLLVYEPVLFLSYLEEELEFTSGHSIDILRKPITFIFQRWVHLKKITNASAVDLDGLMMVSRLWLCEDNYTSELMDILMIVLLSLESLEKYL